MLCTPCRDMFGQSPVRVLFQLPEQHSVLLRLEDADWTAWDGSWGEWLLLPMESPIAFYSGETNLKLSSNFHLTEAVLYGVHDPLSEVKAVPAHTAHYPFSSSENCCDTRAVTEPGVSAGSGRSHGSQWRQRRPVSENRASDRASIRPAPACSVTGPCSARLNSGPSRHGSPGRQTVQCPVVRPTQSERPPEDT